MIRTTVKKKLSKSQAARLLKNFRQLQGSELTVGIHKDAGTYADSDVSVAEVAFWNEFGTDDGVVPERSFIRSAINENLQRIEQWQTKMAAEVEAGSRTPRSALTFLGNNVAELIRNKIKSNVPPPNAPSTQDSKRRRGIPQRTLMDSQLLLRSVGYEINGEKGG